MDAWGDGYGYQIWLGPDNIYMFYGSYGQYLLCAPDKKLFVLTFASCTMQQGPLLAQMVLENILQKAKNTPLPPNLQASQALCKG